MKGLTEVGQAQSVGLRLKPDPKASFQAPGRTGSSSLQEGCTMALTLSPFQPFKKNEEKLSQKNQGTYAHVHTCTNTCTGTYTHIHTCTNTHAYTRNDSFSQ